VHHVRSHPRIAAAGAVLLVALAVVAVFAARSRTPGCSGEPPAPDLPAQLRSLGGFDQPYDVTAPRALEDAALQAASALHPDLAAATSLGAPVDITALEPGRHDAIVFPLGAGTGDVEGLAVFLRACGDQAYFSTVADLAASPPPAFPAVSRERASRMLGTADPQLVYTDTPLRPRWRDPRTGASVAAT
jgi:hypothetical protein